MKTFQWPVRVYYEDTDAGGVVYHANYLKFYERARSEKLRALGLELDQIQRELGLIFVIRSIQVDYLRPALLNDQLLVSAALSDLKGARVNFTQEITRAEESFDPKLLSRATIGIVCVELATFLPKIIPDDFRRRLLDGE